MYRIPSLAAVRVFEAASRHANFSRAAEELAMTQAAVSYQMKLLEAHLGARLFVRRGRRMELTEIGRRIAPRVNEAFATLDQAFAVVRSENDTVLSVTAPQTFATNWLSSRLGAFHIARPNLAVRLDVTDRVVDLDGSDFDMAIRGLPGPQPGMISHFLLRMPVTPMASPAYLAQHPIAKPSDLFGVHRLSPDDDWWDLWFSALADPDAGARPPSSGVKFESQILDGHAAIAGHGVAILSPPMFQGAIAAGQLVQALPQVATYPNGFWLIYPEHKRALPKVRAFRDWLLNELQAAFAGDPNDVLEPLLSS